MAPIRERRIECCCCYCWRGWWWQSSIPAASTSTTTRTHHDQFLILYCPHCILWYDDGHGICLQAKQWCQERYYESNESTHMCMCMCMCVCVSERFVQIYWGGLFCDVTIFLVIFFMLLFVVHFVSWMMVGFWWWCQWMNGRFFLLLLACLLRLVTPIIYRGFQKTCVEK